MFTLILLIYGKYYERVWVKIYVGWLKEFDDNKFDKKNKKKNKFLQQVEKLNSSTESDFEFSMLLKTNSFQKCTVLPACCHEVIFLIIVSTSSFRFRYYFGGPFDPILIMSTVV